MKLFRSNFRQILNLEQSLFRRYPRLRLAAFVTLFVPALYTLIYLSSVWDPNSKTSALPVGVVNQDAGIKYHDQTINIGEELVRSLAKQEAFGYRQFNDPDLARKLVREGKLAFALILPSDFSEHAVPGSRPGAAKLIIYTSEGNNYASAGFARRFAPEVAHRVNEALNEKRWELVLSNATGSKQSLERLRDGIAQLRAGAGDLHIGLGDASKGATVLAQGVAQTHDAAKRLDQGSKELSANVIQLSAGMKQIGSGVQAMQARRASDGELKALKEGMRELSSSQAELAKGLEQLHGGATRLVDGIDQLKESASGILLVGDKIAEGAAELQVGATQLAGGLDKARDAGAGLATGSARLEDGVGKLIDGMAKFGGGMQLISAKLPEEAKLDALAAGAKQLAQGMAALDSGSVRLKDGAGTLDAGLAQLNQGAARLSSGLHAIEASLPARTSEVEGTASGLANSVQPSLEVVAPVANNGTAFAPNFVSLALWVGAVMTAFIFHFHQMPAGLQGARRASYVAGKLAVPAAMVLLQASVMFLMLVLLLRIHVPNLLTFALTLATASLTFLAVVMALVKLLGDAGKFAAVFLLIVQMSASGELMPIELTGGFFQALHPYLPFTWVVRTLRISLFGAFDGAWLAAWGVLLGIGAAALLTAAFAGKWKFVRAEDYRPAIDI